MKNKDLYRETFSRFQSSSRIRWEDYHMKHREAPAERPEQPGRLRPILARLLTAAATLCLLAVIGGVAVAVNFLGLRDLLLPPGPHSATGGDVVSLSGLTDSPEGKALAEWEAFLDSYDADHAILDQVGNTVDPAFDKYICYLVYTQEMADKLEEIAAKYGLKLHTAQADLSAHGELLPAFWAESVTASPTYMYEDGTFYMDADTYLEGAGTVAFQLQRSVRGSLHDVFICVEDVSRFTSWNYRAACGVPVALALGADRAFLLADLGDSVVTAAVLAGSGQGLTREGLETLADRLDLTQLTPAVPPVLPTEEPAPAQPPAGDRTTARETYAAVLRDWLNSGVLPDGTAGPDLMGSELDQFAVTDVDGDGAEELILLHLDGITADLTGYVVGFDSTYTGYGAPVRIRVEDFPMFTFYSGGYLTAGASHNQGYAMEVLWPYNLYRLEEDGSYVCIADVDAWDAVNLPDAYPEGSEARRVARESGGPVYFVSYHYASGLPDGQRSLVLDRAGYESWLDSLGLGEEIAVEYYDLTEENIAALLE